MRIDEINLLGQFKITGNTGNNSQAIGMSGGSTSFIDVVASGGGSSAGLVQRSGYNYVIVEATGDALANGVKLLSAYTDAVILLGKIGTPAPDNRISILLTPGDYNLGGDILNVDDSYIDIVGISQNPLDTIVRASNEFTTIAFTSPGLDFGLYNIDLRSGGTGQQVIFSDSGSGSTYLRMKNVTISGNGFWDGDSFFSFYDLDGEFEDITVLDGCNFAIVSNTLTGTYKNIKIGDVTYAFYGYTTLTGTYKNIKISNLSNYGFYSSNVSGIFEDIKINGGSNIFPYITSGYFKNIIISGSPTTVFNPAPVTGIFEDIEISTAQNAFYGATIDGTFKNIKIGDVTVSSVFSSSSGNVLGTYSNIEIGNVTTHAFYSSQNISINAKDIKIGNVDESCFHTTNGDVTGSYKNITIGDVPGNCFVPSNNLLGTFDTIQVGGVGNVFFYSSGGYISGTFKNIKANDVVSSAFHTSNSILGTYKNISINSAVDYFIGNTINGTFDNISIVSTSYNSFYTGSVLFGTFSNIKVDSTNAAFLSDDTLGGYYDGITIGSSLNSVFYSGNSPLSGIFKNIKVTSCYEFFTSGSSVEPTLVENIEVGECTAGSFIYAQNTLVGTYKNIKVNLVAAKSFYGENGITGTYSNIEINSCSGDVFSVDGGNDIVVNVDELTVDTSSGAFVFTGGTITGTKINKANITGNFSGFDTYGTKFSGILTNSTINMIGRNDGIWVNNGSIERSKVLTDNIFGGVFSGNSIVGNAQVIYNITNYPINVSGATQNVTDSDITS
jgi:hypothetical protein